MSQQITQNLSLMTSKYHGFYLSPIFLTPPETYNDLKNIQTTQNDVDLNADKTEQVFRHPLCEINEIGILVNIYIYIVLKIRISINIGQLCLQIDACVRMKVETNLTLLMTFAIKLNRTLTVIKDYCEEEKRKDQKKLKTKMYIMFLYVSA